MQAGNTALLPSENYYLYPSFTVQTHHMRLLLLAIIVLLTTGCGGYQRLQKSKAMIKTAWEKDQNTTPTYHEVISYYEQLAEEHRQITMTPIGTTDAAHPLHEVVISTGKSTPQDKQGKVVLLINNAIHPGEPCGVDASMMLARDLVIDPRWSHLLDHATVVIIPFYNIGGGLNRGSYSRANQEGPQEHGFRGNARNLDLNRDFIKADSRNAKAFAEIYHRWEPEVFVDTHTSNGADYQYVMTLIATQKDKLAPPLRDHMVDRLLPDLYADMQAAGYPMTPYVYADDTPDKGIKAFMDLPRYSSGYAAMHGSISSMPETHMLKPYQDRVSSTYHYLLATIKHMDKDHDLLRKAKAAYVQSQQQVYDHVLAWELDRTESSQITFKGYTARYKPSAVSGEQRLYYDREAPYERSITYYDTYRPALTISPPKAYIIPYAYDGVIDRLRANGVAMRVLEQDTVIDAYHYRITDYKTVAAPYEGHYLHYDVATSRDQPLPHIYRRGDVLINTAQRAQPYIVQTLEPQGPDSFFAWNFFDGILMQKEHFSPYIFEDTAARMLKADPMLKAALAQAKARDLELAASGSKQLEWVYKRSRYYEDTHLRYPVARVD